MHRAGGYKLGPEPDEEPDVPSAARVIGAAIESGVNWLDTSENYLATHNEEVIGGALAQIGSDDFLVASKVAPAAITGGGSGFRREQVQAACRASLRGLGRDHIDLYFLLSPDETDVPLDETWGAMAELVETGLVRAIGMSKKPSVTSAIAGSRSDRHTRENAGAADVTLSDEVLGELEELIPLGPAFA